MSNRAILPNEFKAENVSFTEPKKVKTRDGKNTTVRAYLLHNDKLGYWETPWVRAPFGLKAYEAKDGESSNHSLSISARAVDPKDQEMVDNWFAQWGEVDKLFTDHVVANSKVALGKQYKEGQREVVEAMQTPVLKAGDEDENGVPYPPRLTLKVNRDQDNPERPGVAVYIDGSESDLELQSFEELENLLPKGARVRLIMQPKLWFISGRCGISLRVLQIQVKQSGVSRLSGFAFSSSSAPESTTAAPAPEGGESTSGDDTPSGDGETASGDAEAADAEADADDSGEEVVVESEDDLEG